MSAPTITSARASDPEASHASVNEPSMEDILASIRRIIAEDQSSSLGRTGLGGLTRRAPLPTEPQAEETQTPEPEPMPEVAMAGDDAFPAPHGDPLRDTYAFEGEQAPLPDHAARADASVAHREVEAMFAIDPIETAGLVMPEPEPAQHLARPEPEGEPLMSSAAGASISSSFQTLAESVMLQDPDLIERVMRESMRPLLKAWLDDHLPSIVERLVRAEIERVARGGRARNT